ncbi:MAG: hypothetical protein JXA58_05120 [Dehalococcoidia bacterium]|nr:hypothetical protein [Dehalococcoidia bacterium]
MANRARTEFARLTGRHDVALRDRIQRQFRADACASVHSTPDGLAYRFGLDMFAFLPDGFEDDLKATAGDFEHAFALMRLRESPARVNAVNKRSSEVVTHEIDLSATLPDMLHEQSYFALYIAHPMLDLVAHQFHIQDAAFRHDYNLWHKQLRRFLGV